MAKILDSKIPEGPVAEKWTNFKAHQRLVNPKNKLKLDVIVVGTGLARCQCCSFSLEKWALLFTISVFRTHHVVHTLLLHKVVLMLQELSERRRLCLSLVFDTVKGGDYRLAGQMFTAWLKFQTALSTSGGTRRSLLRANMVECWQIALSVVHRVSRTFYTKVDGTGQLLLGAYSALSKQVYDGRVKLYTLWDGRRCNCRAIMHVELVKNLVTGKLERFSPMQS